VVDGLADIAGRGRLEEVVGELRQVGLRVAGVRRLQVLAVLGGLVVAVIINGMSDLIQGANSAG
jgi:hypothetical protein